VWHFKPIQLLILSHIAPNKPNKKVTQLRMHCLNLNLRIFAKLVTALIVGAFYPTFASAESAINMHGMFDTLSGLTVSTNKIYDVGNDKPHGNAFSGQVVFIFPSFAFEHVSSDYSTDNVFLGIGFANLLQIQAGNGDQGSLWRIHSDLFLLSYFIHGWDNPFFPTYVDNWLEKIAFSLSYTAYRDDKIGHQYQIGIGYSF